MHQDREYSAWSTAEEERLTELLASGRSLQECADKLHRSRDAVQSKLDRDPHLRPPTAQARHAYSEEDDQTLLRLRKQGRSTKQIAAIMGRPVKGIRARLNRLDKGSASKTGRMGRVPKELTYQDLADRHCRQDSPAPQSLADETPEQPEGPAPLVARESLYARWCRWNDAVAARNAAREAGGGQ